LGFRGSETKTAIRKICPRCGSPYSYIKRKTVDNRVYLYAVHYIGRGRNRYQKLCYLGAEGSYRHVERVLGLKLEGLGSLDLLGVIEACIEKLSWMKGRGLELQTERLKRIMLSLESLIEECKVDDED